ncbi:hypothetical protein [Gilvimarinus sp. DA14]|uniref:hypothetical protein n=1 Tax=Gilvimarinus sp. DA14 TaxID=2956798 RepID=UPI0020B890BB|nr:hypothetical protein [Gilvimarinus sp. DA14]UTF59971.1 hypothetical protein NHM04_16095 [Gilvimarinus sp. DA14]
MEDDALFDLVFRGDIVLGHNLEDVKKRLQQLFKADAKRIEALFTGRPVPLKRKLDKATALKYQAVLQKAGAEVNLVASSATASGDKPAAAPQRGLSLAPVGSSLLRPTERQRQVVAEVNVAAFSLRPVGDLLLDQTERRQGSGVAAVAPDFDLAPAGEALLSEDERGGLPLPELDVEDWGLSEPGADLLEPQERKRAEPVAVAELAVELAPVGSDLGQKKERPQPVEPDISGLRLQD